MAEALLEANGLAVEVTAGHERFRPVDGVSFSLAQGESLALVGESGSGKSLTLRALLGLLPAAARLVEGEVLFASNGRLAPTQPASLRGSGIAMVFQEPTTALNPLLRSGKLIMDSHQAIHGSSRQEARDVAVQLMREVGIPAPEERLRAYPHQLSGGLRQRVMIAMALAAEPKVLLCDEPTTALDVTVQQQILDLLWQIKQERGLAVLYVTHDLAVVGDIAERVAVMYAGRLVETGRVEDVFSHPAHPYTEALLRSVPTVDAVADGLFSIRGRPPDPRAFPQGCRFHPRCWMSRPDCVEASYELESVGPGRASACIHHREM